MVRKISKNEIRERVHIRIRKKLRGTTERPRLTVFRSTAHIYAQVIDDTKGVTLSPAIPLLAGAVKLVIVVRDSASGLVGSVVIPLGQASPQGTRN